MSREQPIQLDDLIIKLVKLRKRVPGTSHILINDTHSNTIAITDAKVLPGTRGPVILLEFTP